MVVIEAGSEFHAELRRHAQREPAGRSWSVKVESQRTTESSVTLPPHQVNFGVLAHEAIKLSRRYGSCQGTRYGKSEIIASQARGIWYFLPSLSSLSCSSSSCLALRMLRACLRFLQMHENGYEASAAYLIVIIQPASAGDKVTSTSELNREFENLRI